MNRTPDMSTSGTGQLLQCLCFAIGLSLTALLCACRTRPSQSLSETAPVEAQAPEKQDELSPEHTPASITNSLPWNWDALAHMAAARSIEARALLLDAQAERHKSAVDTGWRNPRLKLGTWSGDVDESTPARTGWRTYTEEVNNPRRQFWRYGDWEDRSYDGSSIGMRVFLANPFVNRWLRRQGEASAQALEKEAEEESYAIFCEVRTLCLECEILREETELLKNMLELRLAARQLASEQMEAGIITPARMIRAETRLAMLRSELNSKQLAWWQTMRQISLLAGVPQDGLKLENKPHIAINDFSKFDSATLASIAFARRPDLARLEKEQEAAKFAVKAAHAAQIPWFEYIEGVYQTERSKSTAYENNYTGFDYTSRDSNEWQLRTAITIPIFNWLGDEIKLTSVSLKAAQERLSGQYAWVSEEINSVLFNFQIATTDWQRLQDESRQLMENMDRRIATLEQMPATKREEILDAREELLAYQRVCLKTDRDYRFMLQCLETITGGLIDFGSTTTDNYTPQHH